MLELKVVGEHKPNQEAIDCLEDLLAKVRTGEVQSVCYLGIYENNSSLSGYSGLDSSRRRVQAIGELYVIATELAIIEGESYR